VIVIAVALGSLFTHLRRSARRSALAQLWAAHARPGDRSIEVVGWAEGFEHTAPGWLGVVSVGAEGARLALLAVGRFGNPDPGAAVVHPMRRSETSVVGLVPTRSGIGWGVKIARGDGRLVLEDASASSAESALALRALLDEGLGSEKPELVVGSLGRAAVGGWAGVLALVVFLATLSSIVAGLLFVTNTVSSTVGVSAVFTPVLVVFGGIAVLARARRRRGLVAFYKSVIVVIREAEHIIFWRQIRGYDDSAGDLVQLIDERLLPSSDLAIPTPDEAARTAVLALLDRRGIKRLEHSASASANSI
jgi:hypothetical protein